MKLLKNTNQHLAYNLKKIIRKNISMSNTYQCTTQSVLAESFTEEDIAFTFKNYTEKI